MAKKKKVPDAPSEKMLQTFFAVSAETGQPVMATMSSTGMPTTRATKNLLTAAEKIIRTDSLLVADKEHFTRELLTEVKKNPHFDMLTPALSTQRINNLVKGLNYTRLWAGFAIAETPFCFEGSHEAFRLIAQRCGEKESQYSYKAFVTTSDRQASELLTGNYDKRWSVEEFFNLETKWI
jgi:hypothetical protein